jgi:flagellar basal-body rod modification protein FlgD
VNSIDAITAASNTTASTTASTTPATTPARVENPGALLDRDAFLKLLVAQLKYQDPTKPADASQMLAQSAQLTMVDRLNELSEAFAASAATQQLSLAGTIVGRQISFVSADGSAATEVVTSVRVGNDGLVLLTPTHEVPYAAVTEVAAAPAALSPST